MSYYDPVTPEHLRTDIVYQIDGRRIQVLQVQQRQVTYRFLENDQIETKEQPLIGRLAWSGAWREPVVTLPLPDVFLSKIMEAGPPAESGSGQQSLW